MTWKGRVNRIAFVLLIVGALAMASGANWADDFLCWLSFA